MNCMTYSSSNSLFFFEPLIAYQYQLKNSNFTSVFFKVACDANPGAERNK